MSIFNLIGNFTLNNFGNELNVDLGERWKHNWKEKKIKVELKGNNHYQELGAAQSPPTCGHQSRHCIWGTEVKGYVQCHAGFRVSLKEQFSHCSCDLNLLFHFFSLKIKLPKLASRFFQRLLSKWYICLYRILIKTSPT